LRRTAMSWARMPVTSKRTPFSWASASISKSTSHSQETSRPSASLSFMAMRTFAAVVDWPATKVRRISLKPTGFFMSSRKTSLSPARTRSTRPNAPPNSRNPRAMCAAPAPISPATAAAARALYTL
jgi:hypothetical protein